MTTRTLDQINSSLEQAHWLLTLSNSHDSWDWPLIASNIASADEDIRTLQRTQPTLEVPLLGEVLTLLREATASRKNRDAFLAHTKSVRRNNPGIFTGLV